jgi:hypothetical protein
VADAAHIKPSDVAAWLTLISTLGWQLLLLFAFWSLRRELSALLRRIGRFRFGDAEVVLQEQAPAPSPAPLPNDKPTPVLEFEGFLTPDGVEQIVEAAIPSKGSERIVGSGREVPPTSWAERSAGSASACERTARSRQCPPVGRLTRPSGPSAG